MPFIVRVLAADVALWEPYQHQAHVGPAYRAERRASGHVAYRLRQAVYRRELSEASVTLKAPAQIEELIGQELRCWINVERGYLSRSQGSGHRIHLRLERPTPGRALNPTVPRLRLHIARIEPSAGKRGLPRIFLESA